LETKLAKIRGAESSLRFEFDRQLAEEKGILSAKYDREVKSFARPWRSKLRATTPRSMSWRLSESLTVSVMTRRSAFGAPATANSNLAC
jgi:hypothetical protein